MIKQAYGGVMHEVAGKPVLTWPTKDEEGFITRLNLLEQHRRFVNSHGSGKHAMPAAFNDSLGKYIVKAGPFVHATALIMEYVSDRKVGYRFVFAERTVGSGDVATWKFCHVHAQAGSEIVRVDVELPTGEQASFQFAKEKPPVEAAS